MVFVKHNSLKSDIFFNPIFTPDFSGSKFFKVQVFLGLDFSGSGPGVRVQGPKSGSRVQVQVLEVALMNARGNHVRNGAPFYPCNAQQGNTMSYMSMLN